MEDFLEFQGTSTSCVGHHCCSHRTAPTDSAANSNHVSYSSNPVNPTVWYPDSGATNHVANDLDNLQGAAPYTGNHKLYMGNEASIPVAHVGSGLLQTASRVFRLHNILHVPRICKNLLFVAQFAKDNQVYFEFHLIHCFVKDVKTGSVLLVGHFYNGLYRFDMSSFQESKAVVSSLVTAHVTNLAPLASSSLVFNLWHKKLGHLCDKTIATVLRKCNIIANKFQLSSVCSACQLGKFHKLPFSLSSTVFSAPFELVVADIWGPASVKVLQTDWGGEFRSFPQALSPLEIHHRLSCLHTSEQNGLVERKHRHIVDVGLTILAQANVPMHLWAHAVHLINRLPTPVLNGKSPYELLYKSVPTYMHLKVFGCRCYPYLRPFNSNKLQYRSKPCVFLSYSPVHKGYKCLDDNGKIFISRHVKFDETCFPFSARSNNGSALHGIRPHFLHQQTHVPILPGFTGASVSTDEASCSRSASLSTSHSSPADACSNSHSAPGNTQIDYSPAAACSDSHSAPGSTQVVEEVATPLFNASYANQGQKWHFQTSRAVGCKWIFKLKRHSDGSIAWYKGRLVVKGYLQEAGIDFHETFSPVVKPATIRVVLALAVKFGWPLRQIDINNAFLNGDLIEEIYMVQLLDSLVLLFQLMKLVAVVLPLCLHHILLQLMLVLIPIQLLAILRLIILQLLHVQIPIQLLAVLRLWRRWLLLFSMHPMQTRAKSGIFKPRIFSAELHDTKPVTIAEAFSSKEWTLAAQLEYDALMENNTWDLVLLPANRRAVGCKWIFKLKRHSDRSIARYKGHLVVKGYLQEAGIDFHETFSPVVKPATIRVVLALAVKFGWPLRQIDINNAFLNGDLAEEIYMVQPPGFEQRYGNQNLVCRLKKALYGLKQALCAWFSKLRDFLLTSRFVLAKSDGSLFIRKTGGMLLYVLVYVDDIIVTSNHQSSIDEFVTALDTQFPLKDLGPLSYFLGIEVLPTTNGLFLSQRKYIIDLLKRAKIECAKGSPTPMATSTRLSQHDGSAIENESDYRSIVGALQYVLITRPDITFAVNKNTVEYGLHFSAATHLDLVGFSDVNWGTDIDDRRSTTGLAHTVTEIVWLESLLSELHIVPSKKATVWCDNSGAVAISANPVLHSKFKHVELDLFFVREKVTAGQLIVGHVPAQDQVADIFTKPLSAPMFTKFRSCLKALSKQEPTAKSPPFNFSKMGSGGSQDSGGWSAAAVRGVGPPKGGGGGSGMMIAPGN
ncbi:hypothetical protein PVK06_048399 [Gossypium arboreum]|uniref:Integrase catalytic domain-containing protein n=1 Tax=Gossypium arboreum TaxID=29729 RepID=A0ABR0MGC0_GOSAR|nr:hypothetical protein PVK06_048399 [Gossypium arboreum]